MIRLRLAIPRAVAAASLSVGILFITGWQFPSAQEPPQGKPRPDAAAAAGRGASGPRNVIEGTDQDDRLIGGDADDWVFGRKGQDVIVGGRGRDVIDAGEGDDTVDAGPDNDVIDGGAGNDTLRGGDGDDTIEANDDDDLVEGGPGNDDADGGDGNDVLRGGAGDDFLAGGDGDDSLSGGPGNDRLSGNDGNDSIAGGAGDDVIAAGDGNDVAAGEAGDDIIDGGQGDDALRGGPGNDTLTGSWGADTVDGGEDQDVLSGGDGRDVLNGGGGADWLLGGSGTDVVNGGDADDIIVIRAGDVPRGESEIINGGAGDDVLTLSGFGVREVAAGLVTDPITTGTYRISGIERIQHTHLIPHIGLDPTRSTSLLLVNPTAEAGTGRLVFFDAAGALVTPRADALKNGAFRVPPLGALAIEVLAPQAAVVASAQVFSNVPLGVAAQTTSTGLGTFTASESALIDGAMVPLSEDQTGGTGVIVTNGVLPSRIKLTVYNRTGSELGCCSSTVQLPPYAQRTVWVRDLFPRLGEFQGVLSVEAGADRPQEGGPLAIVALQRGGDAVAATPAVRMSPSIVPGPLIFSTMTSGGDTPSLLVLFNPSMSARTRGTVSFFDAQGRPWPVAVNRQPAAATTQFDLAPRAIVMLSTAVGGVMQTGSARVETSEGAVGGVVRQSSATAVTDASPATMATAFVAAVLRDRASGATTDVAITSSGPAATVQLVLHDQSGAQVAGGTAQLRVPAGGQVVRTFDELFPNARPAAGYGAVVATSDRQVAATFTRSGAGPRAILPILPTR